MLIDEDLGLSGSSTDKRSGFARLTSEVALTHVGIVLGLEVSRLARNNADWYRLLELCGVTDTLIGDNEGVYHPALFNDRLLLGLKGTMSEAELHVLRARLDGGIRNKAARGELRRGLPVGFVWGEHDGEVRFHPDEAVTGAIRTVFERFAEFGSARRVWLWFRSEALPFPLQDGADSQVRSAGSAPTYTALHHILTNPVYAGAYAYGKTRCERYVDEHGTVKKRLRHLPMEQWAVLIPDHHPGFIDWATFQANQARLDANTRPQPHQSGGAVREGSALLQGLAVCGHCGRRLHTHYRGRNSTPGYHCAGKDLVNGRGVYCLNVGGMGIEQAVADAFLEAVTPAAVEALRLSRRTTPSQPRCRVVAMAFGSRTHTLRSGAGRAPLPGRGAGKSAGRSRLGNGMGKPSARSGGRRSGTAPARTTTPARITPEQLQRLETLACDLRQVWSAPTTTDRDRKELLRTLLEEVILNLKRAEGQAHLTLRWRGGAITTLDVPVPRFQPMGPRTDEDTISLLRRLAALYPDEVIAGILNRQGRKTAMGERFTANQVGSLRRYRDIPRFQPPAEPPSGELVSIRKAAQILGMNTSSIHRWLADGFIAGEQVTPGAPWQIRITEELRARIVPQAPPEYLPMLETTLKLGVSRQTVLQRVKRGELDAVLVRQGRRKGLRIKVVDSATTSTFSLIRGQYETRSKNPRMSRSSTQFTRLRFNPIQSASNASCGLRPGRNP